MRSLISIMLSVIILLSSSGLTYASHYCGSFKMHTTLSMGKAELSCGMLMSMPACEGEDEDHDCCDNEYQDLLTDDHFNKSQWDLDLDLTVFVLSAQNDYLPLPSQLARVVDPLPYYRPPPPQTKQYLLHQSFLI